MLRDVYVRLYQIMELITYFSPDEGKGTCKTIIIISILVIWYYD
jgi:hypothetical protein